MNNAQLFAIVREFAGERTYGSLARCSEQAHRLAERLCEVLGIRRGHMLDNSMYGLGSGIQAGPGSRPVYTGPQIGRAASPVVITTSSESNSTTEWWVEEAEVQNLPPLLVLAGKELGGDYSGGLGRVAEYLLDVVEFVDSRPRGLFLSSGSRRYVGEYVVVPDQLFEDRVRDQAELLREHGLPVDFDALYERSKRALWGHISSRGLDFGVTPRWRDALWGDEVLKVARAAAVSVA